MQCFLLSLNHKISLSLIKTRLPFFYNIFNFILANEPTLKGLSILLLEGGPFKEYKKDIEENRVYSNRVSALSESSVKLLKSVGAWQLIESLNGFHEVKEMKVCCRV